MLRSVKWKFLKSINEISGPYLLHFAVDKLSRRASHQLHRRYLENDTTCLTKQKKEQCRVTLETLKNDVDSTPSISKLLSIITPSTSSETDETTAKAVVSSVSHTLVHGLNPEEEEKLLPDIDAISLQPTASHSTLFDTSRHTITDVFTSATVSAEETRLTTPVIMEVTTAPQIRETILSTTYKKVPKLIECPGGDCFDGHASIEAVDEEELFMQMSKKPPTSVDEFTTKISPKYRNLVEEEPFVEEASTGTPFEHVTLPFSEELRDRSNEVETVTTSGGLGERGDSGGGGCRDSNDTCAFWASMGECEKNPFWMKPNCQRSCNSCNVLVEDVDKIPSREGCINTHVLCQFWKTLGECESNPDWMREFCALSCDACNERESSLPHEHLNTN
ncbi:unnamed protein product [Soboliphyme baturini]|uniref:ShKT domain-containing protein n=1 Tax=Soboliphyme baturini TaxID=241478 RepID=A0A183IB87_9BILA|nr:unnamed protein product [Soboliphyme baturini]